MNKHLDMDIFDFDESLKNIPIPNREQYIKAFISKVNDFIERLRWTVWFFLNPKTKEDNFENYKFKTAKSAPLIKELVPFENDLFSLVQNIEFDGRTRNTPFQKKLTAKVKEINQSEDVFLLADKTSNIYKVTPEKYNKLLQENITKDYKKASDEDVMNVNLEAKSITKSLKIDDRVECMSETTAFITLKDHKNNFVNAPKCRLINPAKSEVGKISKQILNEINYKVKRILSLKQWRNTDEVISWFKNITNKDTRSFLQFDIIEFYPSITEKLLDDAFSFASATIGVNLSKQDIDIVKNSRKSFLFSENRDENTVWVKNKGNFDVTMGAYDGAELCELIGLFMLSKIQEKFPEIEVGLYRDDGLATYSSRLPGPKIERMRKDFHELFGIHGLKITIDASMKSVNFLDINLDLCNGTYKPYRKPNDKPLYLNIGSNHPKSVKNAIPTSVNKRLSNISSSPDQFRKAAPEYQKALNNSGYNHVLAYEKESDVDKENKGIKRMIKTMRKRKIVWFNPPFNAEVKTNVGKKFLELIDKHFPPDHKLRRVVNRNCIKLSYSCMKNMKQIIQSHNNKIMTKFHNSKPSNQPTNDKLCNCRKEQCPLDGKCQSGPMIYKATIRGGPSTKVYVGCTENYKKRLGNHKQSFKNNSLRNSTCLSKYVWANGLNPNPDISWELVRHAWPYKPGGRMCDLCLTEKMVILDENKKNKHLCLNQRNESTDRCVHKLKFRLSRL